MKLSELIAFRNRLDEMPVSKAQVAANYELNQLMHLVEQPLEQSIKQLTESFVPELKNRYDLISQAFDNFDQSIELVKQRVQNQIAEQEKYWFQKSYLLFEEAEECEKTDQILYGRKAAGEKSKQTLVAEDTLRSRLSKYADWRWPGMIIRPGLEDFIENMVGSDPLYIIDREYDLLQPSLNRFPPQYQNRLRPYTTNDWSDDLILEKIPNNQFGVCLVCNVFNYRPLEIIRRYLEEIYQKLRPGGALLMTYNDCDRASAVMLVEQFCTSYTPGYLIRDLTQNVGFEFVHTWSDGGPSVWLELRKPGQLLSNRGGQAIAAICNIDNYSNDVDFLRRKAYTNDEINEVHTCAIELGLDDAIIKTSNLYDLKVLIQKTIYEQHKQHEQEKLQNLHRLAIKYNIDVTLPNWKILIHESINQEIEENLQKKIKEFHDRARTFGVDPDGYSEDEINRLIAEVVDQRKKDELAQLRVRAMELQAGDPNLIRYGYSSEKLKQLIKAKEERQ